MGVRKYSMMTAMMAAMAIGMTGSDYYRDMTVHNKVKRKTNPWDNINLSKSERRGKTYEEIQSMRKAKWELMS